MQKANVFKKELSYIEDPVIREFTVNILNELPDYFFEIPASSSGKFHPKFALGKGGLVRHTKAAVAVAIELFRMDCYHKCTKNLKSYIISALILHDGLKNGLENSGKTVPEHPLLMHHFIITMGNKYKKPNIAYIIAKFVRSHMGQWNYDWNDNNKPIMPKPKDDTEAFIHLCDYISSRRCIEIKYSKLKKS